MLFKKNDNFPGMASVAHDRSGVSMDCKVIWNYPEKVEDFEFPRLLVTMVTVTDAGDVETRVINTPPQPSYQALSVEAVRMALHPSVREFVARSIFDQFQAIVNSASYLVAFNRWKRKGKKAKKMKLEEQFSESEVIDIEDSIRGDE